MSYEGKGRPRMSGERRMLVLSASVLPQHVKWLREVAHDVGNRVDADVSVSAVVRACIRYTASALKDGRLTGAEMEDLMR